MLVGAIDLPSYLLKPYLDFPVRKWAHKYFDTNQVEHVLNDLSGESWFSGQLLESNRAPPNKIS